MSQSGFGGHLERGQYLPLEMCDETGPSHFDPFFNSLSTAAPVRADYKTRSPRNSLPVSYVVMLDNSRTLNRQRIRIEIFVYLLVAKFLVQMLPGNIVVSGKKIEAGGPI